MNEFAIRTEGLTRDFKTVHAVADLSLQIPTGTIFGFLGPNGAGKTTTIRLLLGLLEPTAGQATVLGLDTRTQADAIRAKVGALLEHSGLYERLSAEDNLEFYGRVWRLSAPQRQARIKELLSNVGLWERRKDVVRDWSRGMKQKLFLDEPTAGLDPAAAVALREDLSTLVNQAGVTVFLTTHNLAEAEKLCAQVGVIRQGRLVAVGHPDELRTRSGHPHVEFIGQGFEAAVLAALRAQPAVGRVELQQNGHLMVELQQASEVAPLVNLVVQAGARVEEVRKGQASLEEAFLDLVEAER
jgi:ABC-2 type transport system ATP-binding protein